MFLQENFKYLILGTIIGFGLLGTGTLAWGEEKANDSRTRLKSGKLRHDPFSLPAGVRVLKEGDAEIRGFILSTEWEEGLVASRVDGIFTNGRKAAAIINHVYAERGSWLGEEQVVEIEEDRVILVGRDGGKRELSFKGGKLHLKVTKWVKSKDNKRK